MHTKKSLATLAALCALVACGGGGGRRQRRAGTITVAHSDTQPFSKSFSESFTQPCARAFHRPVPVLFGRHWHLPMRGQGRDRLPSRRIRHLRGQR